MEEIKDTELNIGTEEGILNGVIWKNLLLYFFPLLFGTFFQQLYNTVDTIVVGRFVGKEALAAVGGSAAIIVGLFLGFFVGIASGATVIIAQYYGAKRDSEVSRAVHTAIALAVVGGAICTVIGIASSSFLLVKMQTPLDTMDYSLIYLKIYFCGMIPNLVYNMGAGIQRAVGDSKRPLYVLVASCFVNIVLDLVFVVVLGLGVEGVAIATILSQAFSAVVVLVMLAMSTGSYRMAWRKLKIEKPMTIRILHIGVPAGIQSVMYTISNLLIQIAINSFDTDAVSAWAAYSKIDTIYWMIIGSLGIAVTTFVGQNYGAGKYDRVKKSVFQGNIISVIFTTALAIALYAFGDKMYYLFTTDTEVIRIGTEMLKYLVPFYVTYILIEILSGALRGMGSSVIPMAITLSGVCIFRIIWILAYVPSHHTMITVLESYPLSWSITSVMFLIYYLYFIKGVGRRMPHDEAGDRMIH